MAFDTAFNITWNQRVAKEETALLKAIDARKREQQESSSKRKSMKQKAMSDADLMSAVRSERESFAGSGIASSAGGRLRSESESDLRRRSSGRSGVLQKAGSQCSSSPSIARRRAPPMTFEEQQEFVFNDCMNRYIKDLEKEAKEAQIENEWVKQKIKDGHQAEIDEKDKRRKDAQENARQLQNQIEENKGRRAHTRKAFVEAASSHNFPLFTETFISQDEVDEYRKNVKKEFREELDQQHKMQQTLRNIIVKKDSLHAKAKIAEGIKKMAEDHANDHKEKRRKGDEMMRVWDRDIRLKNIKSAILNGKDATKEMGV